MKKFCENPNCESPGFKEVPVSVKKPSDQARTLCATCEEAYTWGVQHGGMIARAETVLSNADGLSKKSGKRRSGSSRVVRRNRGTTT
jgi:hypothetical protein